MLQQRWLIPKFDAIHLNMSLKLSKNCQTKKYVNKLINECIGLHLKADDNKKYLYPTRKPVKVGILPHFKTLEEVNQYARNYLHPNQKENLGLISANEDTICLVLNHIVGDGGYFKNIAEHINDDIKQNIENPFPLSVDTVFQNQIQDLVKKNNPPENEDKMTPIYKDSNTDNEKPNISLLKYPINTLQCYNKKTKKCDYLTEAISSSLIISSFLLDKKISNNFENAIKTPFGLEIVSDIRKFSQNPLSPNKCNWYSLINVHKNKKLNMKIGDIYKQMKRDIMNKNNLNELLKTQSAFYYPNSNFVPSNKLFLSFSNLGKIEIKEPLQDVLLTNINYNKALRNLFSLLTYSITDGKRRNELVSHIRYNSSGLDERMSNLINHSIKYSLQNINENTTLLEALKLVKKYQEHYLSIN